MSLYVVGRITAPQGVRGQVRLQPLTDFPERFFSMKSVTLYGPRGQVVTYGLKNCTELTRGLFVLTLEGLTDRDEAEKLRGFEVKVTAQERMPLDEGQYWVDDLIGLTVVDEEGLELGRVVDVTNAGASDLFEISTPRGRGYVPFVDEFVRSVDLEEKKLVLSPIEGLLP